MVIRKVGTSVTLTVNDKTATFTYSYTGLRYLYIVNWNNAKTITYSNIIVKKL